jgi:2-succinyl-5-enolpyruvyl-6-hydroxy-3-cyclohexene-1-carboxylate synthase
MNPQEHAELSPDPACTSLSWAAALLEGLVGAGLRHMVISPGSRSTPLVLAAQRQRGLELIPVLDERSAAFFSLGLARSSRRPVGLACTSGSAPAHWLPAVVEAYSSAVPLVLLSADRPPGLRPWGANQTVDQTRLFGAFVLEFHDPGLPEDGPEAIKGMHALGARAAAVSSGRRPGPVHINLAFPEPLVPAADCSAAGGGGAEYAQPAPAPSRTSCPAVRAIPEELAATSADLLRGRGIIVCGPDAYPEAFAASLWHCADRLALPVLVDPLSGLRFGPAGRERVTRYDALLRNRAAARALRPDWVLRFGAAPVSKTLMEWLRGTPVLLADPRGQWRDPTQDARLHIDAEPARLCDWLAEWRPVAPDADWLDLWANAEARLLAVTDDYLWQAHWCEPQAIRTLVQRLPAGSALFVANSLPVRQLDAWSGARDAVLSVHGNRGASGIDGNVSTLAGLNAGGTPTLGLLGDLALFHDLGGLLLAKRLALPLIVVNNGGGRIFDYLPQHGLPGFEALWRTPVDLDMAALADLFGMRFWRSEDAGGFSRVLDEALAGTPPGLIELRVDADLSRRVHQDFWQLIGRQSLISS